MKCGEKEREREKKREEKRERGDGGGNKKIRKILWGTECKQAIRAICT